MQIGHYDVECDVSVMIACKADGSFDRHAAELAASMRVPSFRCSEDEWDSLYRNRKLGRLDEVLTVCRHYQSDAVHLCCP